MRDIIIKLGLQPDEDVVSLLQTLKSRKIDAMRKLYSATHDQDKTQEIYSLLEDIEKLITDLEKEPPKPQKNVMHKIDPFKKDYANNIRSGGFSEEASEANFFASEVQAGTDLSDSMFEDDKQEELNMVTNRQDRLNSFNGVSGDAAGFNAAAGLTGAAPGDSGDSIDSNSKTNANADRSSAGTANAHSAKLDSAAASEKDSQIPKFVDNQKHNFNSTDSIKTGVRSTGLDDTDTDQKQLTGNDRQNSSRQRDSFKPRYSHRPEKELSDFEIDELHRNLISIEELIQLEETMKEEEKTVQPAEQESMAAQEVDGMIEKSGDLFSHDFLSQVVQSAQEPQNSDNAGETPDKNASRRPGANAIVGDTTKRVAKIYKLDNKRENINILPEYKETGQEGPDTKKSMPDLQSANKNRGEQGTAERESADPGSPSVFGLYSVNRNTTNQSANRSSELPGSSLKQAKSAVTFQSPEETLQSPEEIRLEDLAADMLEAERQAKKKELETLMEFGDMFWNCQNYSRALEYYRKAAEQGNKQALKRLGEAYYNGLGTEQDYKTALSWFSKAAEQGLPEAQGHIGECYYYGNGITQDHKKAAAWYRKAALQGDAFAQKRLADCCYTGDGTDQDYTEALLWYRKAAEQGFVHAYKGIGDCYFYGRGIEQDYAKAADCYAQAAQQGNIDAQINLSGCYYFGDGVEQDYAVAVSWLQKAAAQGSAVAQINLGNCYSQGLGISQDYQEAASLYKKAAEQGHALAQANLGNCYYFGEGVPQDYAEAVHWLQKAAEQGNSAAQFNLGSCYYYGHGVAQNRQTAMKWYQKAADQGNAMAQEMLKNQGFIRRN